MDASLSIPASLSSAFARLYQCVPALTLLGLCLWLGLWTRRGLVAPGLMPAVRALQLLALSNLPLVPQSPRLNCLWVATSQALTLGAAWCLLCSACTATGRRLATMSYWIARAAGSAVLASSVIPMFALDSGKARGLGAIATLAIAGLCAWAALVAWRGARVAREYGVPPVRANAALLVLAATSAALGASQLLPDSSPLLHSQTRMLCGLALSAAVLVGRFEFQLLAAEAKQVSQSALASGLARAQKLATVGTLAAGVAHELASPMTAILGHAQLLRERVSAPKDKQALMVIEEQALRCRNIAGDLTALASERPKARQWVDPSAVLERVARGFAPQARWKRVQLKWQSDPELPPIHVDSAGLEQVLTNLVANALNAAPARSLVQLGARLAAPGCGSIEFEVLDQGTGIAPEVLPRLFEPFFTTRHEHGGTGLGLAVAQGIVRAHGGSIQASNRTDSACGARFCVSLPLSERRTEIVATAQVPACARPAKQVRVPSLPRPRLQPHA